jgi:hypothetical protein
MNLDALTACTIRERGERPSVRPTIIEVAWKLFRERWARRGCHHRRHNRCHRKQQDHAPQSVASVSFRLRRPQHRLSPFSTSRSLTPPYRARVNSPFANRPLGIRRLCIFWVIHESPRRGLLGNW